ncbi:MFS transporter [Rhodococcus sp. 06-470-2]|uniref:MFS transporter n=1 Tax=unclassified Rhodococcus (in: high G+C Gram-positive bacteria) TaxID=192944 RepID=UPI000B9B1786|nr:MFS transporter [Rhodococcus sp. 06-470-2]OZE70986.1 MFS transporter [Rhodococcus sp. 05-2221-1B]
MTLLAMTPVQDMHKPYPRRWSALVVLCLSLLIVVMANTSLLVAAPAMTLDLSLTSSDLQWVIDGYTVPYASLMLLCGVIGDRYSRRGALIIGLIIFVAGSVAGALTDATLGVILARIVMGVAAAIVMPATLSLLVATFPKRERATAVTVWAATSGLAIAAGPLLAGWLLESYTWHSTFLINVPIALAAIVGAVVLVPPSRAVDPGAIDWIGGLLSVLAVSTIVYAIIEGMHFGWTVGPLYFALVGLLSVLGFVGWELRHPNPLLDVRMFSSRVLSGATLAVLIFFLVTFGAIYFVAQYLQFALGFGPVSTGIHLLPLAGAVFVGSGITMWLTPKLGPRITVTAGMVVGTLSVVSLIGIDATATYSDFLPVLTLLGLAIGLSVSPCTDSIMGEFPDSKLGVGGGLNDTALELGGSLGIAVLGSVLAASYRQGIEGFLQTFPGKQPNGQYTGQAAEGLAASQDSLAGAVIVSDVIRDQNAFLSGFADNLEANAVAAFGDAVVHTSVVAAVMFGVGTVIVALLIPAKTATASSEKIAFEPIVPFVAPPAKDPAADREVAELEQLLEWPSAEPQKSGARHALRIAEETAPPATRIVAEPGLVDAELDRPSIYQLASKVYELDASVARQATVDSKSGDRVTIHQLALSNLARTRRVEAEEALDAALELSDLPVAPAPEPVEPTSPLQTFYQRASRQQANCTAFKERSSSMWAMPL